MITSHDSSLLTIQHQPRPTRTPCAEALPLIRDIHCVSLSDNLHAKKQNSVLDVYRPRDDQSPKLAAKALATKTIGQKLGLKRLASTLTRETLTNSTEPLSSQKKLRHRSEGATTRSEQ